MAEGEREEPSREPDADQVAKLIEIELMRKRAEWRQTNARRGKLRAVSFLFLFLIIVGVLFALLVVVPRLREQRGGQPPAVENP